MWSGVSTGQRGERDGQKQKGEKQLESKVSAIYRFAEPVQDDIGEEETRESVGGAQRTTRKPLAPSPPRPKLEGDNNSLGVAKMRDAMR